MDRKNFVRTSLLALSGIVLVPGAISAQATSSKDPADAVPLKPEDVKEFVVAGHGNLDKVKSMLAECPNLVYTSHDWGKGDFETALEGAGHVGNPEIANYLIEHGARPNLFVLTMLGRTDLVKPVLDAYPKLVFAAGPHGLSMLHHAMKGGDNAKELLEYLKEKGLKETKIKIK